MHPVLQILSVAFWFGLVTGAATACRRPVRPVLAGLVNRAALAAIHYKWSRWLISLHPGATAWAGTIAMRNLDAGGRRLLVAMAEELANKG